MRVVGWWQVSAKTGGCWVPLTVVVGAMQASNMGRLVASLPAGVEEGTLFPPGGLQRAGGAVVQLHPRAAQRAAAGREGGQGGVWGRQREGGAVGGALETGACRETQTSQDSASVLGAGASGRRPEPRTAGRRAAVSVCSLVCSCEPRQAPL